MKQNLLGFISMLFFSLILYANAQTESKIILHEKLGDVIDAAENEKYNFFGDIQGFEAAQLVSKPARALRFYVLRNFQNRAQLVMLDMRDQSAVQIRDKIDSRIENANTGTSFQDAVFPIKKAKWAEKSERKRIILTDGSQLLCTFSRAAADVLHVTTVSGIHVAVPVHLITSAHELDVSAGESTFYRSDPHATRLFFGPTARQLRAGQGYFADYYIFFPTLAIGATDYFAMAGGMSLLPGLELTSQLFYFMPKLTFNVSPQVGVGGGFMLMMFPEGEENISLAYGIATFGKPERALTFGVGVPAGANALSSPVVLAGGEIQISGSAKLITENWIFSGEDMPVILSGGVRFFGDRIAVDLALLTAPEAFAEGGEFPFLPWVDFSVVFGK